MMKSGHKKAQTYRLAIGVWHSPSPSKDKQRANRAIRALKEKISEAHARGARTACIEVTPMEAEVAATGRVDAEKYFTMGREQFGNAPEQMIDPRIHIFLQAAAHAYGLGMKVVALDSLESRIKGEELLRRAEELRTTVRAVRKPVDQSILERLRFQRELREAAAETDRRTEEGRRTILEYERNRLEATETVFLPIINDCRPELVIVGARHHRQLKKFLNDYQHLTIGGDVRHGN